MALITTTNAIPTKVVTFNRVQDRPLDPIQVIRVNANSNTTGTGVGDIEKVVSNISLPIGYAYKLLNLSQTFYGLSSTEEQAWDGPGYVEIENDTVSTQYQALRVKTGQVGGSIYYSQHTLQYDDAGPAWQIIDAVKVAPQSSGLTIRPIIYSPTPSVDAVSYNMSATFLQYDSESVFEADIWKIGNLIS